MNEFLKILNEYSALIDFVLFGTIIGILINLTSISRTSLNDKHNAELSILKAKIAETEAKNELLQARLANSSEQNSSKIDVLQYQLDFFQKLIDMPEDKRVEFIKHKYESQIKELESQVQKFQADVTEVQKTQKERLQLEIKQLTQASDQLIKMDKNITPILRALLETTKIFLG